ncbi:arginine N-methyltransferase 2 [Thecamonas trahens ATCC 50062]|uniref:Arginine N-methyltransferase 2 n=1 Tax=Thecamonas trahens ATCC 50062 TaxID=461836 RepID=A0A0L0D594_THETB|nr:arginine N-methyltransferase 2 [Thecamonas trahens ATCC 50062]KNC47241.1 arginine N-methyltransferase 2 [Thecamonas trahens ATCC 50062]|eukprot:XP_013759584.1 arginine N-methyltransferase 2 [Thecamonas trahens ATCC 50062]
MASTATSTATEAELKAEYTPLMHAIEDGKNEEALKLIADRADVRDQESVRGLSPLMLAAGSGNLDVVSALLLAGAPWNALDRKGYCAGDHALLNGHQEVVDVLVNAGVQAELIFKALRGKSSLPPAKSSRPASGTDDAAAAAAATESEADPYLRSEVRYEGDNLIDDRERGVMMEWEKPLMIAHAKELCASGGDVLNVGFGLGLIDTAIAELGPRSHTIIEAHPQVYQRMLDLGFDKKPGVRIVFGRWQDVIYDIGTFDSVFFDTFSDVNDLDEFHDVLPIILRDGGLYSFFNGITPDSLFFQGVACQTIQISLAELGFTTEFEPVDLDVSEDEWQGISNRYFRSSTYYLPRIRKPRPGAASAQ